MERDSATSDHLNCCGAVLCKELGTLATVADKATVATVRPQIADEAPLNVEIAALIAEVRTLTIRLDNIERGLSSRSVVFRRRSSGRARRAPYWVCRRYNRYRSRSTRCEK